tara:strand:- start:59 stop:295 length:237 start_codon:yes stop_codon:yes gene_type:complete
VGKIKEVALITKDLLNIDEYDKKISKSGIITVIIFILLKFEISTCIKKQEKVVKPNNKSHLTKLFMNKFISERLIKPL